MLAPSRTPVKLRQHELAVAEGFRRREAAVGRAPDGLAARHARLLASLGLDTDGPLPPADDILASMSLDKKYRGGVRFVLLEDVGRPYLDASVPPDRLRALLEQSGAGAQAMGR